MTEATVVPLRRSVRIALVALAGLLRDIVRQTLEREDDMAIVAEARGGAELRSLLRVTPAELVIWCLPDSGSAGALETNVFADHPTLKVLTVEDDGRRGSLWELRPCAAALGELSPQLLLDTIRRVVVG